MSVPPISRLEELLVDQATGDLGPDAETELEQLLLGRAEVATDVYERLAAEVTAALLSERGLEPMPASVAAAVLEQAGGPGREPDIQPRKLDTSVASRPGSRGIAAWSGWIAAAAALVGWLALPRSEVVPAPPAGPTVAEIRDDLLGAGSAVRLAWTATEDIAAEGASGDVVWSSADQSGVMRFSGLEPNDPAEFQYQLWIFDGTRDDRFPVDGGVFDVAAGAEDVLVEIRAKIEVREAALFAVTIEEPGGVVVSDRERIVLLAQAG